MRRMLVAQDGSENGCRAPPLATTIAGTFDANRLIAHGQLDDLVPNIRSPKP